MSKDIYNLIKDIYRNEKIVPLHSPYFFGNENKIIQETIDSTFVSSIGKNVNIFEKKITKITNSKYAVAVVNGTSALHLSLIVSNVQRNDLVITQSLSFISTSNSIKYVGADPVFIDIDLETLGLSYISLKNFLENETITKNNICYHKLSNRKIKACIPMHTFGHPVKIDKIKKICKKYNITLIEDSAEAFGSFYKKKSVGTYGDLSILSFNGNKIITTGGGGAILTNNKIFYEKAKHLSTQAKISHPWRFIHDEIGYNYRMPNINAALGIAQLENFDKIINVKRKIALKYKNHFLNTDIKFVDEPKNSVSNFWLNSILLKNKNEKEKTIKFLNDLNIKVRGCWDLIHTLKMYKNCYSYNLKNSKYIFDRLVNLPSSYIHE